MNIISPTNILNILPADVHANFYNNNIVFADKLPKIPKIGLTKTNCTMLFICIRGQIEIEYNGKCVSIPSQHVLYIPVNTTLSDCRCSTDCIVNVVMISEVLMSQSMQHDLLTWNRIMKLEEQPLLELTPESWSIGKHYFELLRLHVNSRNHRYSNETIESLIKSLLTSFVDQIDAESVINNQRGSLQRTFKSFEELLTQDSGEHRDVQYFAEKLQISPNHLNKVCKATTSKTASDIIQDTIGKKIICMLRHSRLSCKEIAAELNFSTAQAFSRYVRRACGENAASLRQPLPQPLPTI